MQKVKELIAYCGIDCAECPAYQATQKDDNEARAKVAEEWGEKFGIPLKPKNINCDGCTAGKRLIGYCAVCEIRECSTKKELKNCAYCGEYSCDKLKNLHKHVIKAKEKLDEIHKKTK